MGAIPNRAGNLADFELFRGGVKSFDVAANLGEPIRDLQAEGDRFGVNTVGAADLRGVFELPGAAFEDREKTL